MAKLKVHLTFSGETIKRPLIYEIGQTFKVIKIGRASCRERV